MRFSEFIGQEQSLADLKGAIANGRVGHAYLFVGPEAIGRRTLARIFAQALLCAGEADKPCDACRPCVLAKAGTHPDLQVARADGATIGIDRMRAVRAQVALKPLFGARGTQFRSDFRCTPVDGPRVDFPHIFTVLPCLVTTGVLESGS